MWRRAWAGTLMFTAAIGGCKVDPVEPPATDGGGGVGGTGGMGTGGTGVGGTAGTGGMGTGGMGTGGMGTGGTGVGGMGTGGMGGSPATYHELAYSTGMRMLVHEGGTYFSVRYADVLGQHNTYVATSTDGITWSNNVKVDDILVGNAQRGALVSWDVGGTTNVGVLWMHRDVSPQEVRFSRSMDGGATYGASTIVSNEGGNQQVAGTLTRGTDGSLWAVYVTKPNGQIVGTYVSRSLDDGATWSPPQAAFDVGPWGEDFSVVAGGADQAWIAVSETDGIELYRTTNGVNWTGGVIVPGSLGNQTHTDYPCLLRLSDGTLLLTYDRANGNNEHDVYVTSSSDGGVTWSGSVQVNDPVTTQTIIASGSHPSLALGGAGRLYAVWSDDREDPLADNHDIYLSYSLDGGATWSADILVNDLPSEHYQRHASIAVVPGGAQDEVVVTWIDQRSGYYDVRSAAMMLP